MEFGYWDGIDRLYGCHEYVYCVWLFVHWGSRVLLCFTESLFSGLPVDYVPDSIEVFSLLVLVLKVVLGRH